MHPLKACVLVWHLPKRELAFYITCSLSKIWHSRVDKESASVNFKSIATDVAYPFHSPFNHSDYTEDVQFYASMCLTPL